MKKEMIFVFLLVFSFSFVLAEDVGCYTTDEENNGWGGFSNYGISFFEKGTCYDDLNPQGIEDSCKGDDKVLETYCRVQLKENSSTEFMHKCETYPDYECSEGCFEGRCRENIACLDTDGGRNYFERGYVNASEDLFGNVPYAKEGANSAHDYCDLEAEDVLIEFFCINDFNTALVSGGSPAVGSIKINCRGGKCENGVCVDVAKTMCIDSDHGINIYEKGNVTYRGTVKYDECIAGEDGKKKLKEQYCDRHDERQGFYECPNGCRDGACISLEEEIDSKEEIEEELLDVNGNRVARGCLKWFDGCNICFRDNSKTKDLACTEMACLDDKLGLSHCIEFENGTRFDDKDNKAQQCNGCDLDDQCYPLGYRKNGNYCSEEGFVEYKMFGDFCENNFECSSNVCISGECIDGGFINRVLNWFKRVFGEE